MFTTRRNEKFTVINFSEPMLAISNAIWGGGIKEVGSVINYTLGPDEQVELADMKNFCVKTAESLRCTPKNTVVLLTAVPQNFGEWSLYRKCFMTVGIGNAVSLYPEEIFNEKGSLECTPGTINSIHILDKTLTRGALVEAYGVARVAIADCLAEKNVTDERGHICVGTRTDCSVVLCPINGIPRLQFAGFGTAIGQRIIDETKDAFYEAFENRYPQGFSNPA